MTTRENRPTMEAAPAIPTKESTGSLPDGTDFTAEDRHAAWLAGVEHGRSERFDLELKDAVQDALHTRALEALGMARRSAVHGPAFSAMVIEAGERE